MPLTSQLQAYLKATQTASLSAPDLGSATPATHVLTISKVLDLTSGTGAGSADVLYSDTGTIAASSNTDVDLSGALANAIGGTSVFVRVKGLYVAASASNTNNVVVGNATSNAWATLLGATHTITLRPGAWILLGTGVADATGYAVTAGTGDLLRIANSGGGTSVSYDLAVIGASA